MDIETKAIELLDKLEALATQYTPEVIGAAEAAVRVTAISHLVYGVAGLLAAYGAGVLSVKLTRYFVRKENESDGWNDWSFGYIMSSIGGVIAGTIFALASVFRLLDLWNWVAIFNPQLALAHKILGL